MIYLKSFVKCNVNFAYKMYVMESELFCIDQDSSNDNVADSDVVDSETEAELYSLIHYEESTSNLNCSTFGTENEKLFQASAVTCGRMNEVSQGEKNREYVETKSVPCLRPVSLNDGNRDAKSTQLISGTTSLNKVSHEITNLLPLDNAESKSFQSSLNNKRKRKVDQTSFKSSSQAMNFINKCLDDSSDSDSIVWIEEDSSDKKEFQTNLSKDQEAVFLSSDSESDSLSPSKNIEAVLRNQSMPNIKIGENAKDVWFVNDKDLYRPKKKNSRRYHDNMEMTCANCYSKGHSSRICPLPKNIKCFICGGGHTDSSCTNRICGKCFSIGHGSRRCWNPCISYCNLCHMQGHFKQNCPDLWRRYHLTTKPGVIVQGKRLKNDAFPYCWNCGQGGHFGVHCREWRGPKYGLPTWPSVVSYDSPGNVWKQRLNSGRHGSSRREQQAIRRKIVNAAKCRNNEANEAGNSRAQKRKKKKEKKLKLQQCLNNNSKAVREKDFPRSPKTSTPNLSEDPQPESLERLLKKRRQRRMKQERKRLRKLEILTCLNQVPARETGLQIDT